jgi:hypothetical protein
MRKQKIKDTTQQEMTEIDVKQSKLEVENNSANISKYEVQAEFKVTLRSSIILLGFIRSSRTRIISAPVSFTKDKCFPSTVPGI